MGVQNPQGKGQISGEMGQCCVMYREKMASTMQKWLNRLRCVWDGEWGGLEELCIGWACTLA